jgi:uncharacterized lipoprotein YddW (UPF0748 family)
MRHGIFITAAVLLVMACASPSPAVHDEAVNTNRPPDVEREFRAVWVATVANIDWPSQRGVPVEQQKEELRRMFDRFVELNLNAVVFQVRPATDALYASEIEPWSEYLTGQMGNAPEPFYDPLQFAVEEAHARGLELHAWFNPFRARHSGARGPASADHVSNTRPEIVREYGRHLWLDPGMPEARQYSLDVIMDVVRRYDIDGVHIDDYFYPYRERGSDGNEIDFPDAESYAAARRAGETRSRSDWRRHNVDRFVEAMYGAVKAEKSHVQVGISPFGIWRPGYPEQIQGFDAYEQIYADAKLWLNEGWLDYFAPQLYWPVDQQPQSYPVLLEWWVGENTHGRHMWPGNFTSRVESGAQTNNWPVRELTRQIELTRAQDGAEGNIHFSARALMEPRGGLSDTLRRGLYAHQALVPATPWLSDAPPATPRARVDGRNLRLESADGAQPWQWVVQMHDGTAWTTSILPGATDQLTVADDVTTAWIRTVNRVGAVSDPAVVALGR